MAHLDFVRRHGRWTRTMTPGAADVRAFDLNQSKAVNGDDGGLWTPSSPIILGGSAGLSTTLYATGGVKTQTGGRMVVGAADGTFPGFVDARSHVITVPLLEVGATVSLAGQAGKPEDFLVAQTGPGPVGIGVTAAAVTAGLTTLWLPIPGRYSHDGSTLSRVELWFAVGSPPSSLPASPLNFLPARYAPDYSAQAFIMPSGPAWSAGLGPIAAGSYIAPSGPTKSSGWYFQCTAGGGGTTGGTEPHWPSTLGATVGDNGITWTAVGQYPQVPTRDATPTSYYNGGVPQAIALDLVANTFSNVISAQSYVYGVFVQNLDATITLTSLRLTYSAIADMRFE